MPKTKFKPKKGTPSSNGLDATLKGAQGEDYQARTVLELVEEFNRKALRARADNLAKATLNEQLFHGKSEIPEAIGRSDGFYKPTRLNYFSNLVLTAASRLQEDRPFVRAYPTHQADRDVARIADALLGHFFRANNIDALSMDFSVYCLLHSATYVRVTWDPDAGPDLRVQAVDPISQQPLQFPDGSPVEENLGPAGDVVWDRFTVFDCNYSGENPTDSEWCTLSKWVSEDEARQMLRDSGYSSEKVRQIELRKGRPDTVFKTGEELVEVKEVWVRPGGTLKDGLFAKVIGGNVAEHMPFPYEHGKIPVIAWKYTPMDGVRWATSPADDAADIQLYINDLQRMKTELVYKTATFTKLVAHSGIAPHLSGKNDVIEAKSNIEVTQGANWLEPPQPPQLLFGEQKEAISQMHEVFGLNEMLSGRETAKAGTSAKAIAYLQKQDSQKHAAAMRRYESFIEEACRQSLFLFIQYARAERQIQVIGEGNEMFLETLKGADVEGADIIIEPASGIERFRAQQEAEVKQELEMGFTQPGPGAKDRMHSGLPEDMDTAAQIEQARKAVHDAAQGHGVQIPPGVSPRILMNELQKAQARYDFQTNPGLQQLEQMVRQSAQPQQGGPPQGRPVRKQ